MNERVYIAGAGSVGAGLAILLRATGRLAGVWNRGESRARRAEQLIGMPVARGDFAGVEKASLVLVCVADAAVADVARALAPNLAPGALLAHTAGALPSGVLPAGGTRGSLHPLAACPDPERAARALTGALYAIEGDAEAVPRLERFVLSLGGRSMVVSPADKPRYHAAAVMASNLVVALLAAATAEAEAAGLHGAEPALLDLAAGALELAKESGLAAALTGPVARGDADTVTRHLDALSGETRALYILLSERALELARARGTDAQELERLTQVLRARDP